ncbi:MAG TPA: RNA polymerase sigma factor [Paracoccaceae bacterium]|nr:RNA polymerase sigma factor [Paracoccaceae bacterium]
MGSGREETDEALLSRFAGGDQLAARILTGRHAGRILSLARRMLRDEAEAEDVAQEAMLRLWRIAPDWRSGEARVSTWLYRVTANLCTDRLRRARNRTIALEDAPDPPDQRPSVQQALETRERVAALLAAIEALPERQRDAVRMRHFDELSNIEIAELMETSVEAVESLLARARRSLAATLGARRQGLGA